MFDAKVAPFEVEEIGDHYFQAQIADVYQVVKIWCGTHYLDWSGILRVNYMVVHAESVDYWFDQLGVPWRESGRPLEYDGVTVRWYIKGDTDVI